MLVGSWAVLLPVGISPPPETVATFVTCEGAAAATSTVTVIGGNASPPARASLREQERLASSQVQPVPEIPVAVRPAGSESSTVMAFALVGALPELRATIV